MNLESIKLLKSIPITHNEKVSKRTINMLYKSLTNALKSWEKNHEKNALKEEKESIVTNSTGPIRLL